MLLAFDSTDAIQGGCTTHVALEILRRLPGLELLHAPRLVRLNPNVPFKTRGNGALCLELGHGSGRRRVVGHAGQDEIVAAERLDEPSPADQEDAYAVARRVIHKTRASDSKSGLAWVRNRPPTEFYEWCVQRLVMAGEVPLANTVRFEGWNGGAGLLGALAASAWDASRGTYEAIAYRHPLHWGTPRDLDDGLGPALDEAFPTTFDNWDPRHRHLRIAPRSPCPILAGIRGTDATDLQRAIHVLGPEPWEDWLLFATNQATGDHLRPLACPRIQPFDSPVLQATVAARPEDKPGGHVRLPLVDHDFAVDAWAFEPTKEFRQHVRQLRAGDTVLVEAGVHEDPRRLSLEAVSLVEPTEEVTLEAPRCPDCQVTTKSVGRRGGYRCRRCGRREPAGLQAQRPRRPRSAARETVPIAVRRHLSRPNGMTDERLRLRW